MRVGHFFPVGVFAVLLAAAMAAPDVSMAATVSADRACYAPGQQGRISGSGYTPGGEVALGFNIVGNQGGIGSSTLLVTADSTGHIGLVVRTPPLPLFESPATVLLSATDQQQAAKGPPPLVTTQWLISVRTVTVVPWEFGTGDPRMPAGYFATGFTTAVGRTLYAHYVLRGRLRKTVPIGRLKGPCGDLPPKARRPQFPFRPVPAGVYRIKVDAARRYPNDSPGRTFRRVRVSPDKAVP